jgi:putative RNA 2'-phosphotransferase
VQQKEQISKLISYWLRHAPHEAGLAIDDFGWTNVENVLAALKEKNLFLSLTELEALNKGFDKVRWEIREGRIRATHGHSIPVLMDTAPTAPPEFLYHGTALKQVRQILGNGLKPMSRQFVHLAADIETAVRVGERHGLPLVFTIGADELHRAGQKFYKVNDQTWLTGPVAPSALRAYPWHFWSEGEERPDFKRELEREVGPGHLLYPRLKTLKLVARRHDLDDMLFEDTADGRYYVVHLTFTGSREIRGFPSTRAFLNFDDWLEKGWYIDQADWL